MSANIHHLASLAARLADTAEAESAAIRPGDRYSTATAALVTAIVYLVWRTHRGAGPSRVLDEIRSLAEIAVSAAHRMLARQAQRREAH